VQSDSYEERSIARLVESYETQATATKSTAPQAFTQPCERDPGESLISRMTETSVADAFGRLGTARVASQPQTVEDLMKEMLRPMLKVWLDDNLPALVERLVKAEIERVTRG
jgi:cell pole-organizing protein PopZ